MLTNTLGKGHLFYSGNVFIATTVPLNIIAHTIDNSECLNVLKEVLGIRVFINPSSLALLSKEFFQWVLRQAVTEKSSDIWYGKCELQQLYKQPHCRKVKGLHILDSHCIFVYPNLLTHL